MLPRIRQFLSRFSVYGDFPSRLQTWGAGRCPHFMEPIFVFGHSVLFYPFCGNARRALMENLAVLFPQCSRFELFFRAFRVFWNFAATITDAARARGGQQIIDWEIEGESWFQDIVDAKSGVILLTAHMGNYDVAAPMFAGKFGGRRLNAVRAQERDLRTQEWMQRELQSGQSEAFTVQYNTSDNLLGIDLIHALSRSEIVAVQGDRVQFGVSSMSVPLANESGELSIPKGPFALALSAHTPIYPLFVIRVGRRRYRILIRPPFECRAESRDRDAAYGPPARIWVDTLMTVARRYWYQWYVFEPVFQLSKVEEKKSA